MTNKTNTTELRVGVKAFLRRKDGKYLLIKRSPVRYAFMKDRIKWEIAGGRMEPDLTIIQNLAKEVKEEVGLNIIDTPTLLAAQDIMYVHNHKKQVVRLTYAADCSDDNVLLNEEEVAEHVWVTMEEMLQMESEIDPLINEVLKMKAF